MKKRMICRFMALLFTMSMLLTTTAYAWTDQAHMAMGKAVGFKRFQNCAAPDISHTVAVVNNLPATDSQAHFFNVAENYQITSADVIEQVQNIGKSAGECPNGYLLGIILHTTRLCKERTEGGKYDDEYYAVLLHYIADLAQPLHLSVYDDFNRTHHYACDDILSNNTEEYPVLAAMALAEEIKVDDSLYFRTEEELLKGIVSLAKQTQEISNIIRAENRDITFEEAKLQIIRAAALGKAVMRYCGKIQ